MRNILFIMFLVPSVALASGVDRLKTFLRDSRVLKANFDQSVLDRNGKPVQNASGVMQFSRPGRFRWVYEKPYAQVIVGDGVKVWMYDPDLNQVTVKRLDQALGSSPAALLAGDNEIERNFVLSDGGTSEGLEWVSAAPRSKEGGFESIRVAFKGGDLAVMSLRDQFGQTTTIRFHDLDTHPRIAPQTFVFIPPKGADIVGE